ncbi:hypothetical protein Tco_1514643 [Tanacetum coccineum]
MYDQTILWSNTSGFEKKNLENVGKCFKTGKLQVMYDLPQHIDEFDLKDETLLSEYDEEEQNILYFNDLFLFNIIHPDDLKSEKDNHDNEIDIKHSSRDMSVKPLPYVNKNPLTDVGCLRLESQIALEQSCTT